MAIVAPISTSHSDSSSDSIFSDWWHMPAKRRARDSPSPDSDRLSKRPKTTSLRDPDDDDDLDSILAQINEQDASEALARKLQDEWNAGIVSSSSSPHTALDEDDDEALARRLSQEWAAKSPSPSTHILENDAFIASSSSIAHPSPSINNSPDIDLSQYRDLFTAVRKCTKCGADVESPRGFVTFSPHIPPPSLNILLHAPCHACHTNHCRGCFTPLPCARTCKGKDKNPTCTVESCCAEVRAVAVFETLGGFDRQYLGEQETSASRAREASLKRSQSSVKTVGPGGTGYSTGSNDTLYYSYSAGRSRGRGRNTRTVSSPRSSSNAGALAAHWEDILVRSLQTLMHFLPSPYAEFAAMYDMLPHPSLQFLLSLSQLPELLGSLLRNDSVTDWITRANTYHAMLDLLRRLADSELTVDVLIGQRWEKAKSCGLEVWMWEEGAIVWEKSSNSEKAEEAGIARAPPLYEHFKKLTKQCEAFMSGASQMLDANDVEVEDTMIKATSLCGDIVAARDDMDRVMAALGKLTPTLHLSGANAGPKHGKWKGKSRDTAVDLEKTYTAACERLAFMHVMLGEESGTGKHDGITYPRYAYAADLQRTENAMRNPRDRLHLVKELAVMATCLPPGVWMRVDEVRNDAIKIMIAGPEGTPYAGGLFEFDCFMPLQYPHTPPLMHLRTTGGGRVRFNPNLYGDGKVCLSLLGTWPGRPEEQWSATGSTLLQVVVSIQSMILIEAPFFNEPGYGLVNLNDKRSISYNRDVSLQTVRWGMVEWLQAEHKDGIWGDVIFSHFTIRHAKIRKCIEEWAVKDPRMQAYDLRSSASVGQSDMWATDPYGSANGKSKHTKMLNLVNEFDRGVQEIESWCVEPV